MQNKRLNQRLAKFVSTGFKGALENQNKIQKEQKQMEKSFEKQKQNVYKYFKN